MSASCDEAEERAAEEAYCKLALEIIDDLIEELLEDVGGGDLASQE